MVVEEIKKKYVAGTRIILKEMNDPAAPKEGTKGTVSFVDDIGTIHVNWDNGSSLGLIVSEDLFEIEED